MAKTGESYQAAYQALHGAREEKQATTNEPQLAPVVGWHERRLLIWGTTYPEFSKSYYETVCTGALDEATGRLVRIYPITLRYLDDRFRHYQWIRAEVERNSSDFRPEARELPHPPGHHRRRRPHRLRDGQQNGRFRDVAAGRGPPRARNLVKTSPGSFNRVS